MNKWTNESIAWISLGDDDFGYRTIDNNGNVLTDKSKQFATDEEEGETWDNYLRSLEE